MRHTNLPFYYYVTYSFRRNKIMTVFYNLNVRWAKRCGLEKLGQNPHHSSS